MEDCNCGNHDGRRRTVLFEKDGITALLAMNIDRPEGGAIMRLDPRMDEADISTYKTVEDTLDFWREALKTSKDNGWRLVHSGEANWG